MSGAPPIPVDPSAVAPFITEEPPEFEKIYRFTDAQVQAQVDEAFRIIRARGHKNGIVATKKRSGEFRLTIIRSVGEHVSVVGNLDKTPGAKWGVAGAIVASWGDD